MRAPRFLEARAADERAAAVLIQGAPFDAASSWRAGAADGPRSIRVASDSIESYSPRTGRDLVDVDLADAGDMDLAGTKPADAVRTIAAATEASARSGALVVTLGGDHSISIGTSLGLHAVYPDLVHLVFDAHLDLREEWEGDRYSHACGTRHMAALGPTCALGIRSGAREEFHDARHLLVAWSETVDVPEPMREAMTDRPVFVSVDLDVLDPSTFPGTGNPEPGGVPYVDLRAALLGLADQRVVGIDFTECAPPLDPAGLSPIVAAELVRDCILALGAN